MTSFHPVILRPSPWEFVDSPFGRGWLSALGVVLLGAFVEVVGHPDTVVVMIVMMTGLLVLAAIPVGLYLMIARIRLEGDRMSWRKIIRHGSFTIAEVNGAAYDPMGPLFVIVDRQNRRLLRLHTRLWSADSLDALTRFIDTERGAFA